MRSVEVDGLRIAYEQAGAGPPLVLVHGGVTDSRIWRLQLDALSAEFTVIAWDAPGCGQSDDPPPSYRLPEYADALAGMLDRLQIERAHVLGHSFGGALALELYRRHPELPATLILVAAYAGWAGSLQADEVRRRLAYALDLADGSAVRDVAPFLSPGLPPQAVDALTVTMSETRRVATRAMAHALADADLRGMLPSVAVPTLLVYGDADERAPVAVGEAIAAAIPDATLVTIPGAGHECYLEDPVRFNDSVRRFLQLRLVQ
jgi:pimeloyl-ACP methyl ester carboxylesterase